MRWGEEDCSRGPDSSWPGGSRRERAGRGEMGEDCSRGPDSSWPGGSRRERAGRGEREGGGLQQRAGLQLARRLQEGEGGER